MACVRRRARIRVKIKDLRSFLILSLAGTIAIMPLLVLPAMVGVLVDESAMSESFAGISASVNFLGGAAIALVMAFYMHHIDLRLFTAIAFVTAALMDVVSAFSTANELVFILARIAAGVGAGGAYTCIVAAFARYRDVDRGYGIFITLQFIVSGIGLYLLPVYATSLGTKGMFLMIAGLEVLALLLVRHLPGKAVREPNEPFKVSELGVLLAPATLFAVLGFGLFETANTAQFTYVERLGVAIDLVDHEIGTALLVASLAGIPGAFIIVLIGDRFGRIGPLALGITISVAGLLGLIYAQGFISYQIACICLGFAWAFCLPFIQGMLALLDRNGTAIAAGAAASTVGGAAGPGIAAVIVGNGQYQNVFMTSIGLFVLCLAGFVVAGVKIRHRNARVAI